MQGATVSSNPEQIRSFIAIELSEEAKKGLARLRRELERDEHKFVKWVDPGGIHLTLKFLGNIPSKRVTEITEAMEEAAQGISPFHLEISGLGAFPSLRQARVFWVGIGGELDKLSRLQQNIDSALAVLGFTKEEDIAQALTAQYGFPYLPLSNYEINPEIANIIPVRVARQYMLVPIDKIGNNLTLAMSNPLNVQAIEDVELLSGCNVQTFVSTSSDIKKAIEKYYKGKE
jgi:2'-5' RNA ligase